MASSDDQSPLTDEEEATEAVAMRDCADQKALESVVSQSPGFWTVMVCYAIPLVFLFTPLAWLLAGRDPGPTGLWFSFIGMLVVFTQAKEVHLHYRILGPLVRENRRLRKEVQSLADQVSALTREQA